LSLEVLSSPYHKYSRIQNVGLKVSSIQNEFKELALRRQIVCQCNLSI
jgi:hypothetical protein